MNARINYLGLLFLLLIGYSSLMAQTPVDGATAVAINTTYTIPSGVGSLINGITYTLNVLDNPPATVIGSVDFVYNSATGNTVGPISLGYNTTYKWGVWSFHTDPIANPIPQYGNGVNPFSFTTILGPPTSDAATSITSSSFSANWTANVNGGATSYILRVGTTTPGGTEKLNDVNVGNVLTYSVSGLTANTTYYYSVKANDGTNTSIASNEITVNTSPAVPTLTAPINGLTGVSVLPTFTWNDIFDENSFTVNISTAGSNQAAFDAAVITTGGIVTAANATSYTTTATDIGLPLNNGTTYYWQISVQGGSSDGAKSSIYHFTTVPVPTTVNLATPANLSTVYSSPATFQWSLVSPTTGLQFIVQYKYADAPPANTEDETFWSGAAFTSSAPTAALTTTGAVLLGKTYYWRVLAQRDAPPNDYVYYPLANVYSTFSTAGGSSVTIIPTWPTGGNKVYTNSPTLSWYINQAAYGLKYQVNYSKSNAVDGNGMLSTLDYPKIPTDAAIVGSGSPNFYLDLSSLDPGTTYYWQVRAYFADGDIVDNDPTIGPDGWSAWSTVASFVTNGSGTPVVPIPSYPDNGVTVYTTAPTLFWYLTESGAGLKYDVEVATTAALLTANTPDVLTTTSTLTENVFNSSEIGPLSLTPGQTYYWRVRSNNGSNPPSAWSEDPVTIATFTVAGGITNSYPVLTWPVSDPTIFTTQPTLSWYLQGPSLGLTGYVVKYKKDSAPADWAADLGAPSATQGQAIIGSVTTTTYDVPVPLNYSGHYYWAVATSAGASNTANYYQDQFDVIVPAASGAPILSQPVDGSTAFSTLVTISWYINGPIIGIDHYNIEYGNTDIHDPVTSASSVTQSKDLTSLTSGATYWWRVQVAYADGTFSIWSSWWSFNVQVGSSKVVQPIIGGPNNVKINTASPMLSWVIPTPATSGLKYEVEYADNLTFTNSKTVSDVSNPQTIINGLSSSSKYYWRVRSKAADGTYSYYSNTGKFDVGANVTAVKDKEVIPTQFSVDQNYPNPFNPSTVINYALPKSAFVSIKIYNMLGQEVKTLVSTERSAGIYSVQWNGDNNYGKPVSSGTYIYRVVAGEYVRTMKMVLLK